jgi:hypothetical protein
VLERLGRLRARIAGNPAWGAEHPRLAAQPVAAVLDDAVRGLSSYHTRPILARREQALHVEDVKLLYYYQNRTAHAPADSEAEPA